MANCVTCIVQELQKFWLRVYNTLQLFRVRLDHLYVVLSDLTI
jgi:hypothetical protein